MDYEKKYKEALELARDYYKANLKLNNADENLLLEDIFPELKESESEKIREALIKYCKLQQKVNNIGFCGISLIDAIAWLKKQGESYTKKDIDDAYLKGICDAKHELEKQGEQKPILDFKASNFHVSKVDGKIHDMTYNPANKVESKVGEKIEDEIEIPFGAKDSELQEETYYIPKGFHAEIEADKVVIKKGEKPTAWSDEDENYLQSAENACEYQYGKNTSTILWLKSLKDRIEG